MNLEQVVSIWKDDEKTHQWLNDTFVGLVNATPELKAYRDWIEQNIFGFGERSFIWMWKLLVDEMPTKFFTFLEVGVFRGQVLGIVRMLAPEASISGVTPLDSTGGHWESDYTEDIKKLHETFKLRQPHIFKGLSTDGYTLLRVQTTNPKGFNMVYIDGGHEYETVKADLQNYCPMVKVGGFLIIDDCCHKYKLPNGFFPGIESVSKAVDEVLPNEQFQELFSIVHNRVFKRIK